MQGYRKALWMMQYMKKPDFMMIKGSDREVFDPKAKLPTTLRVKVYMVKGWDSGFQQACFSTWSSPNFYTRVGITGVRESTWELFGTRSLSFSLQYQSWRCSKWKFPTRHASEGRFFGVGMFVCGELRHGIRSVPLYDHKAERLVAVTLLMQFQFVYKSEILSSSYCHTLKEL
ncbi:hypothetical protein HID58_093549 [Brassica napus]|uniref:Uncharacterized protein n=1 Tax=Brassica napus TaxID=3708 RepID=A0ABQ7XAK5_BRANA|nr:hypothetical protein HID58_093549 [Brassica napus]